jgi:hypothetical protein
MRPSTPNFYTGNAGAFGMTDICIFASELNDELETIGFYFLASGAKVVYATHPSGKERSEHPWSLQRVEHTYDLC